MEIFHRFPRSFRDGKTGPLDQNKLFPTVEARMKNSFWLQQWTTITKRRQDRR